MKIKLIYINWENKRKAEGETKINDIKKKINTLWNNNDDIDDNIDNSEKKIIINGKRNYHIEDNGADKLWVNDNNRDKINTENKNNDYNQNKKGDDNESNKLKVKIVRNMMIREQENHNNNSDDYKANDDDYNTKCHYA